MRRSPSGQPHRNAGDSALTADHSGTRAEPRAPIVVTQHSIGSRRRAKSGLQNSNHFTEPCSGSRLFTQQSMETFRWMSLPNVALIVRAGHPLAWLRLHFPILGVPTAINEAPAQYPGSVALIAIDDRLED